MRERERERERERGGERERDQYEILGEAKQTRSQRNEERKKRIRNN